MSGIAARDAEIMARTARGETETEVMAAMGVTQHIVRNVRKKAKLLAGAFPPPSVPPPQGGREVVVHHGEIMGPEPETREQFAAAINRTWRQATEAIFAVGRQLAEAKAALGHGDFLAMVESDLPFGARTAQRLMAIAADARLVNTTHASHLPPSWMTLYELTKLDDDTLSARLADGTIHPEMQRRDIAQVRKRLARQVREEMLGRRIAALPDRRYGIILSDWPSRFEPRSRDTGMDRAADNHYPTMTPAEAMALTLEVDGRGFVPVADIAFDDAALFFWTTRPLLQVSLAIVEAWGFAYKTCAGWDKIDRGTGYWFADDLELLIVATRGNFPAPDVALAPALLHEKRGPHSAKPDFYAGLIERAWPHVPKLEMFRRGAGRPGWDAWGNEVVSPKEASQPMGDIECDHQGSDSVQSAGSPPPVPAPAERRSGPEDGSVDGGGRPASEPSETRAGLQHRAGAEPLSLRHGLGSAVPDDPASAERSAGAGGLDPRVKPEDDDSGGGEAVDRRAEFAALEIPAFLKREQPWAAA